MNSQDNEKGVTRLCVTPRVVSEGLQEPLRRRRLSTNFCSSMVT
jgi:hypothetical protein